MDKLVTAGWDGGRLNNKLYLEDNKFLNMNAICSGYDRRVLEEETGELQNFLDVEVYKGEEFLGRYFVGNMAYKNNRGDLRWSAGTIPKFYDSENNYDDIIKMVTYLALSQYDPNNLKKKVSFRVGTGVPTEEYFEHHEILEKFCELFNQPYKVIFKHELFSGAEIEISVPKIHFKPEGTASILSFMFSDDLQMTDQVKDILNKRYKIIGINIGSSTTDAAIMKSNMEFESAGFFGIDVGSSKALNEIRAVLYTQYGYDTTKLKVDYLIRNYNKVNYKGQIIDLSEIKKVPFSNLISLLKTKFYDEIEMRGVDLSEVGALFVSGGAIALVGKKLENFIDRVPTVYSMNPLFDDARGYYLEAKTYEISEKQKEKEVFEEKDDDICVVS